MGIIGVSLALLLGSAEAITVRHRNAKSKYEGLDIDYEPEKFDDAVSPKAFVVSTFEAEKQVWHKHLNFSNEVIVPGLSPLYPKVYCTKNYDLCNVVTGEGEINAAATVTALLASPKFNLSETYFLVAGIAGIDPAAGSLGSAAFARFTVSVALQYEVDSSEKPSNWTSGYWAYGTNQTGQPPKVWYGTEVFEVNEKLRDHAASLAYNATLTSTNKTIKGYLNETNSLFNKSNLTAPLEPPKVLRCDSATSDVYFTGNVLSGAFANTTKNITNGTANYCTTAQEDAAILEAALRSAIFGLTDYSRWVLLRTASDYDRPPKNTSSNGTVNFLLENNNKGFDLAIENLYKAGYPFIKDVLTNWNTTYRNGTFVANSTRTPKAKNGTFAAPNYVGDVFGSLGGKPDFGPGSFKGHKYI